MPRMIELRRDVTIRYSRRSRQRKALFAVQFARDRGVRRILVVGASGGLAVGRDALEKANMRIENQIERFLVQQGFEVTMSGVAEASAWDNYVDANGLDLPFDAGEYDLVYSNAVIEHVGGRNEQQRFVAEHARVGKHWILTTPNRYFPVESHSDVFFAHWRDSWIEQSDLVTRLLGRRNLAELLPPGAKVHGQPWSPTLTATSS